MQWLTLLCGYLLTRTPINDRQFFSQGKAHIFSLKLTCLLCTPVNVNNRLFSVCPKSEITIYRQPSLTDTGYLHVGTVSFPCRNHVPIVDIVAVQIMTFLWVNKSQRN